MERYGIDGIITPLITPFRNGSFDEKAIGKLNSFVEKIGVKAVFPAGSTGCFPFLTLEEHVKLLECVNETKGKKVRFIPGVGRNSIEETKSIIRSAERMDPFAMVVVTPYYVKLDDDSLFRYFDRIASSTESNIILYNIPQMTQEPISVGLTKKLIKKHENIIGIKESSGDFRSFTEFSEQMPEKFLVFQGQDDLLLPSLDIGANAGVCGTTNFTDIAVRVYNEYKAGDMETAKKLQEQLTSIMERLKEFQFPKAYNFLFYKRVMNLNETNAVEPITELSKKECEKLEKIKLQ